MTRMPEQNFGVLSSPYHILRLDEIPQRISFYQLLTKVESLSRHIIGIARTADYVAKRLGRTIYFYCTSLIDARFLEQCYIDYVGDGRDGQACTIVDSVVGRAALMNSTYVSRYDNVPVTVLIKGFERQPDAIGATDYLKRIVSHFENPATVTAFRLNYDVRRATTRNDAFVTFLSQSEAREFGGEKEPINHLVFGRQVSAILSDNVPMMVRVPDSGILVNGLCAWTNKAERLNQLVIRHGAPFVHPRKEEPDTNTGDRPLEVTQLELQAAPTKKLSGPSLASVIVRPPSSKASDPARGSVNSKKANSSSKAHNKTRRKDLDKLSTKAVYNKKRATNKRNEQLVYDSSEDEIVILSKPKRLVIDLNRQTGDSVPSTSASGFQHPRIPATRNDSDDDGHLIINEEVELSDGEDSSRR